MFLKKYGDLAVGIAFLVLAVAMFVMAGALPPSVKRPVCAPGPGEFVPACEEGPDSPKGWGSRNLLSPVRPKGRTLRLRGQTGTPMPRG